MACKKAKKSSASKLPKKRQGGGIGPKYKPKEEKKGK